ncbi:hypothetical protein OGM23_20675 [Dickeya fangzhongdai]|uniref:hypothetical protein n=1 Tax=Dickeya fangzhongdai TaxID=1778540 RepID=UPI002B2AC150|nr:hypothetical protein OGM23_20675 [Dickeya fangzhongdai]
MMELDTQDSDNVEGRYFYRQYRKDLALYGKRDVQGQFVLSEGRDAISSDADASGFTLKQTALKGWQGEWHNSKGKRYPVTLSPLTVAAPASSLPFMQSLYQFSPYEYLRHGDVEVRMTKRETVQGYEIEWWQDPITQVNTFQITSGYTLEQRERLNAVLRRELWAQASGYHECMMATDYKGEINEDIHIHLLSPSVVSYDVAISREYCGGAHPDFGIAPTTLRVSDANELTLEDMLWVGSSPIPDRKTVASSDYSYTVFADWLVKQFTALYPQEMRKPDEDKKEDIDTCDYSNPDVWGNNGWYLTPEGIYFYAYFARVMRSCDGADWSILPWYLVKQHPGRLKDLPLP